MGEASRMNRLPLVLHMAPKNSEILGGASSDKVNFPNRSQLRYKYPCGRSNTAWPLLSLGASWSDAGISHVGMCVAVTTSNSH